MWGTIVYYVYILYGMVLYVLLRKRAFELTSLHLFSKEKKFQKIIINEVLLISNVLLWIIAILLSRFTDLLVVYDYLNVGLRVLLGISYAFWVFSFIEIWNFINNE